MSKRQEREAVFLLLFEKCFNLQDELELIIENAQDARDFKSNPNILTKTKAILENSSKLDEFIEKHLKNWTKNRISKVALCVLRIAVFEILNEKETPENVSINEAVEITKYYSTKDDAAFVNGVLGSFVKEQIKQ